MNEQHNITFIRTSEQLDNFWNALDELHSQISEHQMAAATVQQHDMLIEQLSALAYVATESAAELTKQREQFAPEFRVIEGGGSANTPTAPDEKGLQVLQADKDTSLPFYVIKRVGG